jgi:hypothetical protein
MGQPPYLRWTSDSTRREWRPEYRVVSCDLGVFAEEAAKPVSSDDLNAGIDPIGQCPHRADLVQDRPGR